MEKANVNMKEFILENSEGVFCNMKMTFLFKRFFILKYIIIEYKSYCSLNGTKAEQKLKV